MTEDTSLQEVAAAHRRLEQARTDLHEAVIEARPQHTWAEIGAVLGMTRQAAFKRFGSPRDPRTGDTMHPAQATTDLLDTTEKVFRLIDAGDYDALAPMMTKNTAAVLTRELILDTWAQAVADTGNLVDCRDTRLELPDGTPIDTSEAVHGTLIGHTTINCEAGHWVGRVAYNTDQNITGVLIVPPNHDQLPF
ncbi:hypothetical protein AC792_05870 [Arthrobacter sp. RIT-PI-e]|uniref:hypothetical protein n=1 Tax=Arthrobacter sp. RIT-PI-e TaxID=1681197 RepID=UPI0006A222AA|nr:hypothetical protein [Arthrobacter sp. RIT-PI-e]KNC19535.1 hypothetical protein AC792_05870 [Arthrobacter sp. RIT-PI-e]